MARPKNQTARREQISAAARRSLVTKGTNGLQLKHIAEEAGMSSGSILYYYPDLQQLLIEVYEHAVERFSSRRRDAAAQISDASDRLARTILSGLATGVDDEEVYLLHIAVGYFDQYPSVKLIDRMLFDRQVAMYETILETGAATGDFTLVHSGGDIARHIVALEDTYNFHIVTGNPALGRAEAARLISGYAELATGRSLPKLL